MDYVRVGPLLWKFASQARGGLSLRVIGGDGALALPVRTRWAASCAPAAPIAPVAPATPLPASRTPLRDPLHTRAGSSRGGAGKRAVDAECKEEKKKAKKAEKPPEEKTQKKAEPPKKRGPHMKRILIYRYNPNNPHCKPTLRTYCIDISKAGHMVLDALIYIKNFVDPTLAFRRSCREGICGSCAMNIRGTNQLACIAPIHCGKEKELRVYPLPHMYVLRDLVVDQTHFFEQYASIHPWLKRCGEQTEPVRLEEKTDACGKRLRPTSDALGIPTYDEQLLQSMHDRKRLDGLYECILCGCCSAACPPYWWNYKKFLGPAILLHAYRWIIDSRDHYHNERLCKLNNYYSVYRCHTIFNCTSTCPKKLNPGCAIATLKRMLIGHYQKEPADICGKELEKLEKLEQAQKASEKEMCD